jgi:hypothetical protein
MHNWLKALMQQAAAALHGAWKGTEAIPKSTTQQLNAWSVACMHAMLPRHPAQTATAYNT